MAFEPTRLLLVEDNPADARLVEEMLKDVKFTPFEVLRASTVAEAVGILGEESPDAVLLDLTLPDSRGLATVSTILRSGPGTPVIVQTGTSDDALALRAVRLGAQDYVRKGETDSVSLARTIRYAVERKRSEHMIERANSELEQRNARLRQLTYAMTHDLQTPLATLTGAVESLRTCLVEQTRDDAERWLNRICTANDTMVTMLDDLMVYAKAGMDNLAPKQIALGEPLGRALKSLAFHIEQTGIVVDATVGDEMVIADSGALTMIFQNLLGNAIKYAGHRPNARVAVSSSVEGGFVTIRVCDNGPGVDPSRLEELFAPFARASSEKPGSGLGLAIARQYAERLGGAIRLESDGKSGTTVIVSLPPAESPQSAGGGAP